VNSALAKRGPYATATFKQIKNANKKWSLIETDVIRKAIIYWKRRLYSVSKEKADLFNTTFANM